MSGGVGWWAAAPGAFPVADGAYALARAVQRLEKADAACDRDFCRAPASLRPPPAPRKKKRTRAPARDLDGARRTLGFGDSDEEVDSWTCRECAYPHTSPAEAAMVACAACGERRPSRAKKAPPATPSACAVLAPNLETAINVVWDAGIGVGDRVAVVGAGVSRGVGLGVGQLPSSSIITMPQSCLPLP